MPAPDPTMASDFDMSIKARESDLRRLPDQMLSFKSSDEKS